MNNVYALVDHYYEKHIDAEQILEQEIVEQYLRMRAWHGDADERLRQVWTILSLLITYVQELNLYGLESLSRYDYEELLYRYAAVDTDFTFSEKQILELYDILDDFFSFFMDEVDDEVDYHLPLDEAREALYDKGKFEVPKRRSADEFYSSLDHMDFVPPETLKKLNTMLDKLMDRVTDFFRQPLYEVDIRRAVQMFSGPDFDILDQNSEERGAYWHSFWDYFLFDYHLIRVDDIPMHQFYEAEKENLTQSEQDVLQDFMRSRFTVFEITESGEDFITCHDIFRDEDIFLPTPDYPLWDYDRTLLYGHIRSHGVMMLNYITSVPATMRLRTRMKEEILRLYQLFQYQCPDATLDDFFAREAIAVRHTIRILSSFAQLNVVPFYQTSMRIPWNPELRKEIQRPIRLLRRTVEKLGYSVYASYLISKLFHDFVLRAGWDKVKDESTDVMLAVPMVFARVNGIDLLEIPEVSSMLGGKKKVVLSLMQDIESELQLHRYDPRYLTEEGFVASLYTE